VIQLSGGFDPATFISKNSLYYNQGTILLGEDSQLYDNFSKFHGNFANQASSISISSVSSAVLNNTTLKSVELFIFMI
jgi:hypothetical protein